MLEKQAKIVYLGIGSNLGNKKQNITIALDKLRKKKITIVKISKYYESFSWPDKTKPKFVNVVVRINTNLSPINLMKDCLSVEKELGRKRIKKNEPRICDIDIIDYNKKIISKKIKQNLVIPHPKMHKRNFVLLPMFEICKKWTHPVQKVSIKVLINSLKKDELRGIKII